MRIRTIIAWGRKRCNEVVCEIKSLPCGGLKDMLTSLGLKALHEVRMHVVSEYIHYMILLPCLAILLGLASVSP